MKNTSRSYHIPILRAAALLAIAFMLTYILILGKAILQPFVVALLLFFFINTLANFFTRISIKKVHMPIFFAKVLATFIIFGLMILSIFLIISVSVTEIAKKWNAYKTVLVNTITAADDWAATQLQNTMGKEFDLNAGPIIQTIQNFDINAFLLKAQQAIGNISVFFSIMVLYLIFLLLEQRVFRKKLMAIFPNEEDRENVEDVLNRIGDGVFTYVKVKTTISMFTGISTYLVLLLFGVEFALFWGILTFILNFIPNVGSLIAVVAASLASLAQLSPSHVFILFILLTIIQQFFGAYVDPKMSGNRLNLSPLVIILSLVFWGKIWGILGAFFCVPLTVIIFIMLSNFEATRPIAILLSSRGIIDPSEKKTKKWIKKD